MDTASDDFPHNARLFIPATKYNRFAVTREINDGLLASRIAPSQKAWVPSSQPRSQMTTGISRVVRSWYCA